MQEIQLATIPNQTFNVRLDNHRYEITLQTCEAIMAASIVRDGVPIVSGARCVSGYPLINYRAIEDLKGNFVFDTLNEELPFWEKFGQTQFLYYVTQDELIEARSGG